MAFLPPREACEARCLARALGIFLPRSCPLCCCHCGHLFVCLALWSLHRSPAALPHPPATLGLLSIDMNSPAIRAPGGIDKCWLPLFSEAEEMGLPRGGVGSGRRGPPTKPVPLLLEGDSAAEIQAHVAEHGPLRAEVCVSISLAWGDPGDGLGADPASAVVGLASPGRAGSSSSSSSSSSSNSDEDEPGNVTITAPPPLALAAAAAAAAGAPLAHAPGPAGVSVEDKEETEESSGWL